MATSRAFTKNTGETAIPGTYQVGLLTYHIEGSPDFPGFVQTGLKWYNGPDEDLGYVICAAGNTNSPDGSIAPFKFYRSNGQSEAAFINLAETVAGKRYVTSADAAADLETLGILHTWPTGQQTITYTPFGARTSACGEVITFYFGSDNKYYTNESGNTYSGLIYTSPVSVGGGEYSWNVNTIYDGINQSVGQELSLCSSSPGEDQFLTPA